MTGSRQARSRSRSPIRGRGLGLERRAPPRERNANSRGGLNQHSDRMVYISNLPYEMTWMELKDIIREKAGEVNFVEIIEERNGKSKGCAVVEFKTRDSAIKSIEEMHRIELKGRHIVVKEIRDPVAFFRKVQEDTGIDFLGTRDRVPAPGQRGRFNAPTRSLPTASDNETYGLSPAFLDQLGIKPPLVNRIFITNISYNCGVGRLFDVCSLAGKVTWLDLQLDKDGKSKGMAVCQYSHPIEAVQAVSMLHDQRLFDRTLSVKMDRFDKDPASDRREGELPTGLRGIGMGLGANGAPLADVASVISSLSAPQTAISQPGMNGGASGLVAAAANISQFGLGGASANNPFSVLPAAAQPQMVQQPALIPSGVFGGGGGDHAGFHSTSQSQPHYGITQSGGGGNQPTSVAYFGSGQQQQAPAIGSMTQTASPAQFFNTKANGAYGGGSSSQDTYRTPAHPSAGGGLGAYSGGSAMKMESGYGGGAPTIKMESYGGGGSSYDTSRVILIKNLPMDYTWQIVSDRVQQFGELESVEMISPGVAKVRFVQISDAERAKATLQSTTVEGRVIGIEYL